MPARDGHERNSSGVVTDLLDEAGNFLADLLEPGLAVGRLGGVHLVGGHDELLDPEGVGEQGVLPGLAVLGDTSLELTSTGGDDEDTAVSLDSNTLENNYNIVRWTLRVQLEFRVSRMCD